MYQDADIFSSKHKLLSNIAELLNLIRLKMPILVSRSEYDELVANGSWEPGRVYDIYED